MHKGNSSLSILQWRTVPFNPPETFSLQQADNWSPFSKVDKIFFIDTIDFKVRSTASRREAIYINLRNLRTEPFHKSIHYSIPLKHLACNKRITGPPFQRWTRSFLLIQSILK